MTFRSSGSGPGVQAPDGCSVDLYRITPYYGELVLAEVPDGAARVLSDIESLNLDESFDVALLAGNFINAPEAEVRSALVHSAAPIFARALACCLTATILPG